MYRNRSRRIYSNDDLYAYVNEIVRNLQEFQGNYSAHVAGDRGNICGNGVLFSYASARIKQIFNEIQLHNNNRIIRGLEPHHLIIAIATDAEWLLYRSAQATYTPEPILIDPSYDEILNSMTGKPARKPARKTARKPARKPTKTKSKKAVD